VSAYYLARRILQLPPLLWAIATAVFLMLRMVPGDPAQLMLGIRATPEGVAALRHQLGYDRPLVTQYFLFILRVLHGDFGSSVVYVRPVRDLVEERLPATMALVAYSALLMGLIALPTGVIAAIRRGHAIDRALTATLGAALAVPSFWVGTMFLLVLGVRARLFPVGGVGVGLDNFRYLFLPALTLAISGSALLARNLRSAILDVIHADYVRTAHAKGVPPGRVLTRHVLRNALLSTITLFAARLGFLIGSTVVIESVFAIPGIGTLLVNAVYARDYPVVQAITLLFSLLIVVISLITDVVYTLLDPRVRFA
jgi:peptide/nickel transport system permease protein